MFNSIATASAKRKRSDASDHSVNTDDVSQDFKDALQDLSGNDRYQISNLTVIAKESTEHAMAISEVLLLHISKVSPTRKLPALYVLDSIVKNVGTPYTDFLSQNLFKTFMEAYTLVDQQTRKQMENMLKTWKEPVPGSTGAQPVFPLDTTRPIENALIKARTMFIEQQKQQGFSSSRLPVPLPPTPHHHALSPHPTMLPIAQPWRDTSTPPQSNYFNSAPPIYYPPHPYQSPPPPIPAQVQSPALSYHAPFQPAIYPAQATPQPYPPPQPPLQYPYHQQPTPQPYSPPPPATGYGPQPSSYSLATLLQVSGTFPNQPPGTQARAEPQPPTAQFPGLEALFRHSNAPENSNQLIYDRVSTPQPPTSTGTPVPSSMFPPPANTATTVRPPIEAANDSKLTNASLKIPRPSLIETLYAHRPSQCTTCGRRFPATPEGAARKSRHLDAHFRTNMKFTQQEAEGGRGVNRSWYVGEIDWIGAREFDDADEFDASNAGHLTSGELTGRDVAADAGGFAAGLDDGSGKRATTRGSAAESYLKAPADAAMAKYACPICQEDFNAIWHDGAQEWVWMDAVRVGDKVYHGSCLGEMAKDRGGAALAGTIAKSKVEA